MMPKEEESKQKSQKLDHITEIIGIFGPFHGFWYTVLGETYYFFWTYYLPLLMVH